jgi:hypothetical protein
MIKGIFFEIHFLFRAFFPRKPVETIFLNIPNGGHFSENTLRAFLKIYF